MKTHWRTRTKTGAMGAYTKLQLFLGLVGSMCLITMLFFYLTRMPDEMRAKRFTQQQEQRKELLQEMCDSEEAFSKGKKSFEDVKTEDLHQFMVDDNHGIVYCFVPKVASSSWKRFMLTLNKSMHPDPMSFSQSFVHDHHNLNVLYKFSRPEIKAKLERYTKFLFVRDPFVRLISAYRNKLEEPIQYFYTYVQEFLRMNGIKHPPNTFKTMTASGMSFSFNNFTQYLIDPRTQKKSPFNNHWMQMYRLCHPCAIKFDFIGHLETLKEDAEELFEYLKLKDLIPFPFSNVNNTTMDYVSDWFKTVSPEDRRKLYKLYEGDFKLFGYPKPSVLLNV